MYITFENDLGKIVMGGGSTHKWRITEIVGIGLPPKEYNVTTYAGQDGQETLSVVSGARTITISGDVRNDGFTMQEITRAMQIFNKDVTVKIQIDNKQRKALCKVNTFELGEKNGAARLFVLQLVSDDPYFSDFTNKTVAVFETIDHLKDTFTLPMVFTTRVNESDIQNRGDVKTEPIFYVYGLGGGTGAASEYGIEIENTTTNQSIILNYSIAPGETVTIDIPKRKITGSSSGNLIRYISNDTFLSNFWLDVGVNHIVVTNYNTDEEISLICEYTNKYIEAVN